MKMIPADVFAECQERARGATEGDQPVSRVAAVAIIVAIWLLCVALAIFLAFCVF
jgi:hypothetical protein